MYRAPVFLLNTILISVYHLILCCLWTAPKTLGRQNRCSPAPETGLPGRGKPPCQLGRNAATRRSEGRSQPARL